MWPEYGLINYGVQTAAAALERAREDASFADDGKEYEFLARHTDDDAGWGYVSLEGWKLGILQGFEPGDSKSRIHGYVTQILNPISTKRCRPMIYSNPRFLPPSAAKCMHPLFHPLLCPFTVTPF